MKEFVRTLLLTMIVCCWSCSDGGEDIPTPAPKPETTKIEITTSAPVVEQKGGTATISFTTNAAWTANVGTSTSWLKLSPTSGVAGTHTLTVTTSENDTYDERNASITLKAGNASKSITVTQKQKDALIVTSNKVEIGSNGGDFSIEAKANVSVSYEIEESAKDWISAIESRGLTAKTLNFTAKANDKTERRQGNIILKGGDGLTETVTVYQAGEEVSLVLTTPERMTISSEGGILKIEIQSNLPNVQMHIGSGYKWVESIDTNSNSNYTFYLKIHPNESYDERVAVITFKADNLSQAVYVIQKQQDALLLNSKKVEMNREGGTFNLKLQSNIDVTYEIEESAKDWISALDSRGLTNRTLSFLVKSNESLDNRQATITLTGGDNLREVVTVFQEGDKNNIILSQKEYVVSDSGGTIKIELKSNVDYKMILPDCIWISESASRSLTAYSHYLDIKPNESYDSRSEDVLFVNENYNLIDTVHIIQIQKNAIVIAKNEYVVNADETNLSFPINSDLDITVSTDVDWIKQFETTNELVNFTIKANESTEIRNGTISISCSDKEQIIKIKQKGCIDYEAIERASLIELYNATNGEKWSNNRNWCSDKPLNEWYGVSVNQKGRVITLGLNKNNLTGYVPESIGNLTSIQKISLDQNQLGFNIPQNIGNLIELKYLNLSRNKLEDKIPESIGNLLQLTSLSLTNNNLSGIIPESIGNLAELKFLDLSHNKLEDKIPESIGNLLQLTSLILNNNNLSGIIPESIGNLSNLSNLSLSQNQLCGKIPTKLTSLKVWEDYWSAVLYGNSQLDVTGIYIPAPDFTTIDTEGSTIDLGMEYVNNKLTILYIWGGDPNYDTYYNSLVELYDKYRNKGMKIIGSCFYSYEGVNVPWQNFFHYNTMESVLLSIGTYSYIIAVNDKKQVVFQSFTYNYGDFIKFVTDYFQDASDEMYTSTDYTRDGEIVTLQTAYVGKGIDLVFMGEAFVDKDMETGGKYEQKMKEAMEVFFSIEPYKSMRYRFNVYAIKVISPNAEFTEGAIHRINEVNNTCFEYAQSIATSDEDPLMITVVYNTEKSIKRSYCDMFIDGSFVSYIMAPIGNVILHESGGHGFAGLLDEYVESGNEELTLPEARKNDLDGFLKQYGFGANVDWRNDASTVKWSHFLNDSRYANEGLGLYEGAYLYGHGAYRPTKNSMMSSDNAPFNAPSREQIYKRIMQYSEGADWKYDYEEFVKYDEINRNNESRSAVKPLTEAERREYIKNHRPPTFIKGTWRDAMKNSKSKVVVPLR